MPNHTLYWIWFCLTMESEHNNTETNHHRAKLKIEKRTFRLRHILIASNSVRQWTFISPWNSNPVIFFLWHFEYMGIYIASMNRTQTHQYTCRQTWQWISRFVRNVPVCSHFDQKEIRRDSNDKHCNEFEISVSCLFVFLSHLIDICKGQWTLLYC